MREPDAVDGARVLGLALLAYAALGLLQWAGLPPALTLFLLPAAFLGVPLLYARATGLKALPASGFRKPTLRSVVLVLLAALGSLWILKGAAALQMELFEAIGYGDQARTEKETLEREVREVVNRDFFVALGAFVVAAPFCEETLFRGIMFRGFLNRFGPVATILLTTVPFALLHGSVIRVGMMVVVGVYFGLVVWLTGNLWAGILAHAVNNLVVVLLTSRFGDSLDEFQAPWWMMVLSAVVFAMSIALLEFDRRERRLEGLP